MDIYTIIQTGVAAGVKALYNIDFQAEKITINPTRKEFEGDYTVVVFPFTKVAKKKPDEIGQELGQYLKDNVAEVTDFNVIKGFLNLVISDDFWLQFLTRAASDQHYGRLPRKQEKVMVEFSSPNTNKPLHLGHIRNILLGWSCSQILDAAGYDVVKVQIINDRGIAICKSMLAWRNFGMGETPTSSGMKSDHFVGKYYVLFEQKFQEEYKLWQQTSEAKAIYESKHKKDQDEADFFKTYKNTYFNEYSQLGAEARQMLLQWEANNLGIHNLWKQMNGWVYQGFNATYEQMGVHFDKLYYESETYLLGKESVEQGLADGTFYQKEDGSVWIDLTDAKLDHKIVLRSDGTSVYMTQDIGTAQLRYEDFKASRMVYTVADEQNYHFQVLFEIMKRLKAPYAEGLHHLSYGMVDLPTGKMKSREGTVVDADDLMNEVIEEARKNVEERGELDDLSAERKEEIIRKIGLAALKFFIIKVQPKKRMTFDPKESVDMQGQTGPYVQNAYVRIQSILKKAGKQTLDYSKYKTIEAAEKDLLSKVYNYPEVVKTAAENYDPSEIANYCYDLAKQFHKFYHDYSILKAQSTAAKHFRLELSAVIADVLAAAMGLLGIEMPERM